MNSSIGVIIFVVFLIGGVVLFMSQNSKQQKEAAANNIAEGKKFLEENAKKEGIIIMPSGLQYEVLTEGAGDKPALSSTVKAHYHGTLIDGTVFDSSVDRGEPLTFGINQVIKGWQEGIPLMSVGAKYRFYIPQELAYGMRAPSATIGAGATLIFEVKLLDFN
jgi:FKBP-type peptidyl-prolyl cis-trans isomerase